MTQFYGILGLSERHNKGGNSTYSTGGVRWRKNVNNMFLVKQRIISYSTLFYVAFNLGFYV